jgi:PadR family transcriptional regulator, regulatory protein PadR
MQNETPHQDLYSGLIRLHILHHACEEEIFGLEMIEELGRHGYKLSPGTMYPILHSLERRGLLISKEKQEGRRYRKFYSFANELWADDGQTGSNASGSANCSR